jgi:hypothetical protein
MNLRYPSPSNSSPGDVQKLFRSAYLTSRVAMAALAGASPWVLYAVGKLFAHVPNLGSMSAYYHIPGFTGDFFVGALSVLGAALYLYKGFSRFENNLYNVAGFSALCVAFFPTGIKCPAPAVLPRCGGPITWQNVVHAVAAHLLFILIGLAMLFCSGDWTKRAPSLNSATYLYVYRCLGILLIIGTGAAGLTDWLSDSDWPPYLVEAVPVTLFACYWLVKTKEVSESKSDLKTLTGQY